MTRNYGLRPLDAEYRRRRWMEMSERIATFALGLLLGGMIAGMILLSLIME